ncbi:MAG: winged helix-turn-helix domain-containing protein [Vulcanimicrobiaceae bacterium]
MDLSAAQARRIALGAQGFTLRRPSGRIDARHVRGVFALLGVIQIDSVNVLVRSQYLPLFSRLGPYNRELLDAAAYGPRRRTLFEYWAHEASLVELAHFPLLRWRMERARKLEGTWGSVARFARERPDYVEAVRVEIEARGPLGAGDLERPGARGSAWWGWSEGKLALEYLFWAGMVTTAQRRNFERLYDLTERVIPSTLYRAPVVDEAEAQRGLLSLAARALGIATERDLRDYFRLGPAEARGRIAELVEAGALRAVSVEGWKQPAYVPPNIVIPRKVAARALLSPFDSLVWDRARTERVFDFAFRLEIYTPQHKRVHGYYVLPFLLGERLVARVDLKADRARGRLLAHAVHLEPGVARAETLAELRDELRAMAGWLELDGVESPVRGLGGR